MNSAAMLLFGAFNPVTNAHVGLAAELSERFMRYDIVIIPSKDDYITGWKKYEKADTLNAEIRLALLREAVKNLERVYVSDVEIRGIGGCDGKTYNTVNYFKSIYDSVAIVVGDEKPGEICTWFRGEELIRENHFVVVTRENCSIPEGFDHELVKWDGRGISSTAVREAVRAGELESVRDMIPANVYGYYSGELMEKERGMKEYSFDAEKNTAYIIEEIRKWFDENGPGCNAVLGISGGKDSSISAALCVRALGKERVIGVRMPNGLQPDIDMAKLLCEHLDIKSYEINIKTAFDGVLEGLKEAGIDISEQTRINLAPRIRMSTLYAVSQSNNGRVINTCNLSEDHIGYSTRYGDAAGDFSVLGGYTVDEVKKIGRVLGLPEVLIEKAPSDGLTGKTDEDNIGFTYAVLDRYIRTGEIDDPELKKEIDRRQRCNEFKLKPIPYIKALI